ncbi:SAM-dependent methyltransferase [Vibrio sp. UCD-FRSSP16_10]|uniref:tRNA1(Val) (adenine(37)-N6)-methyltransferase n=1 Tax=unclassified Vibrio TaxID=2614977 RepID=UPI0007FDB11E|nr:MULTISPECIES: methyltransferase [unclassified Vibrio]OBT07307.1 SAM-dependent methyltransferase [Vibrio sp. UCD-FRSSP16_30]OBT12787.1 SAM-dependent methyltransferase [Vibrio sp. UCD-FRSSP16_10]
MHSKTKSFQFKHFSIYGGNTGMPVSTDGVLLGAWSALSTSKNILDIGTGTGLLALMCAQRNPTANITGIDIHDSAIEAAHTNFSASAWAERLTLHHGDVIDYALANNQSFDTIICNPPYFNSGEQAALQARATARHTDTLSHHDLLNSCATLLNANGRASFILPTLEADQLIAHAIQSQWHLTRLCKIRTTETKSHSRYLFELQLKGSETVKTEQSELIIHQQGSYSAQFIALTQSFYLKM